MNRFVLPLILFVGLVVLLWRGLALDPQSIPSTLIDRPAPGFALSELHDPEAIFRPADMIGKVWVLNVWASWCVACREEHPVITALAEVVDIIGLNYKDRRDDATAWLAMWGDPYQTSAFDREGNVGIDYGVYGVPETFIIDAEGWIRYKHIGPVSQSVADEILLPIIQQLENEEV